MLELRAYFCSMKSTLLITASLLLSACYQRTPSIVNAEAKISEVMAQQEDCWNRGNIECFMQGYWNSDSLRFIGKSGVNYGWQATLDNYKRAYPDRATMGKLEFDIMKVEPLGTEHYLVTGKWKLTRETDSPNGLFTLIWKRFGIDWKIVYDHSS